MSNSYDFNALEAKWQAYWDEQQTFRAANPGAPGSDRPKFYVLDFFPYPSGAGLHVGHPLGYIASDIMARFMRMRGHNVLHPMGWDAFGLPAEQYAIETGVHPRITTQKNIETYKRQLRTVGLSYDWQREVATCDPAYYRWTQWIFSKIFNAWYDPECRWTDAAGRAVVGRARPIRDLPIPHEVKAHGEKEIEAFRNEHRLAFVAEVPVNWCPALGTVLANEEVTNDGRSDRGNHPVYRRPLRQWMLRITEYADRLLADLEELDWPEPIKLMQRNWIGRSEGAYVDFTLDGTGPASGEIIRVFTTRPDTLFGATYMVLAPEHSLVPIITTDEHRETVRAYVDQARQKTELDRTADAKKKTGVFTGAYAINPVNRQRVPIWVADYVLMGYGTGSIMAVPAHDTRDLEFAQTFGLPVLQVVQPPEGQDWRGFVDDGVSVNSPAPDAPTFTGQCSINGLPTPEAQRKITQWLEERDLGEGTVQYKLRDWLFSRQRYWGEPFPILFREDGTAVSVPEEELPVMLPDMEDFKPVSSDDPNAEPQTPLARAEHWVNVERGGQKLRRETNTMPQWAGSCWYYLRFCDPENEHAMIDRGAERYWLGGAGADGRPNVGGVDLYMGGAEHAVLHLLYARFWHKVLYDLGHVSTPEPFHKLFNQGMIGAAAYRNERGVYVPADEVIEGTEAEMLHPDERKPLRTRFAHQGQPVVQAFEKMSKSLKNVVNPDDIIKEYGADTLRLYEMYMGPLEKSKPWNTADIIGVHRFLQRVWRLVVGDAGEERAPSEPRPSGSGPAAPVAGSAGVSPAGATPTEPRPQGSGSVADSPLSVGAAPTLNPKIVAQRDDGLERLLHKTIKKVTADIATFGYNTAIAQLIVWSNEAAKATAVGRNQVERFVLLLAPFAPHIAEELWQRLGHAESLAYAPWPQHDEALTRDDVLELPVQVNGKLRGRIAVPADATDEEVLAAAEAHVNVAREIAGKTLKRRLVVKGRLVNLIV